MSKKVIEVKNVKKTFKIPLEKSNGLKQKIINLASGSKGYREFSPLKDISFDIEEGDFFGIVGRNGSGKSTLLKIMAGVYTPTEGTVNVNGTLIPFIELGVGFNHELSGRENVFLNGALLGFSHEEMEAMYDDIVEFAELEDFMDERLKNYSSGMQVRLAFSIAIRARGDILLLDEVLAVGDEAFQRKCNDFFEKIKKDKSKTVILVTHSMDSVMKYCNKALMIKEGEVVAYGSPSDVTHKYKADNLENKDDKNIDSEENRNHKEGLNDLIPMIEMNILSKDKIIKDKDKNFDFEIKYKVTKDIKTFPSFSFHCEGMGRTVFDVHKPVKISSKKGVHSYKYSIPTSNLNNGTYMISSVIRRDNKNEDVIGYLTSDDFIRFIISREYKGRADNGLLNTKGEYFEINGEKL